MSKWKANYGKNGISVELDNGSLKVTGEGSGDLMRTLVDAGIDMAKTSTNAVNEALGNWSLGFEVVSSGSVPPKKPSSE